VREIGRELSEKGWSRECESTYHIDTNNTQPSLPPSLPPYLTPMHFHSS